MPRQFHLTSMQQTTNRHCFFNYTRILECNRKQVTALCTTLYTNLSSVLLYESSLAVCCRLSGCPCRLRLCCCWWHCPYGQTSRADKAQSGQLPLGFWRGGGGLYCTLKDKERRPRLTSESSQMPLLSVHFVVLWASFKNDKSLIFFSYPSQNNSQWMKVHPTILHVTTLFSQYYHTEAPLSAVSDLRHLGCARPALHTCICAASVFLHCT